MQLRHIIQYSRPHFRLYLIWPFLLWYAATMQYPVDFISWSFIGRLIYFTLPANILIYGVNDIADYDTDKNNPKKQSYELLLTPDKQKTMRLLIVTTNIPFFIRALSQWQYIILTLLIFWFFGIFYSSKPIRTKAIPFLDGIFNILYIIPWFLGYFVGWWIQINRLIVWAGTLRCMAMHAYSAIPDIQADKKAKIQTTATVLGKDWTLLYCLFCRIIAGMIGYTIIWPISFLAMAVYITLITISWKKELFTIYKWFPVVNIIIGMLIFFKLFLQ